MAGVGLGDLDKSIDRGFDGWIDRSRIVVTTGHSESRNGTPKPAIPPPIQAVVNKVNIISIIGL
jgi:hypothetical protein